jgi:hypothetical protein
MTGVGSGSSSCLNPYRPSTLPRRDNGEFTCFALSECIIAVAAMSLLYKSNIQAL